MNNRKLKGGMVGGGIGSFIGPAHRMGATLDGEAEFVCGVFSSDPEKSVQGGKAFNIETGRIYRNYREMAEKEAELSNGQRIDFVTVATPNWTHFDIAKTFLEAGFHVICDKPMTITLQEAKDLRTVVEETHKVFVLTHNYTGYPMVKQARHMVRAGELGRINKIFVEYSQGGLARRLKAGLDKKAMWRLHPDKVGQTFCIGDIGTHAENLARYISGLEIQELCADLTSFVPGSSLDNDGNILIHYSGGTRGVLCASSISTGEENRLSVRIYGTELGLEWNQETPNYLIVRYPNDSKTIYAKGKLGLSQNAHNAVRLPSGHPEGFIEAFANIYREAFRAIRAEQSGQEIPECDFPNVSDGVMGMAFVETVVASASSHQKWTQLIK